MDQKFLLNRLNFLNSQDSQCVCIEINSLIKYLFEVKLLIDQKDRTATAVARPATDVAMVEAPSNISANASSRWSLRISLISSLLSSVVSSFEYSSIERSNL